MTINGYGIKEILLIIISIAAAGLISAYGGVLSLLIFPFILAVLAFLGFITGKLKLFHYVAILIVAIVFSPGIKFPGMPAIRLDDLWLLFGFAVLLVKYSIKTRKKFIIPEKKIVYVFLGFLIWISITILISSYREPYFYSSRDWLEVIKNLKLIILFLITVNLKLNKIQLNKMNNVFIISLFISALFGFAQFFNIANVNSWLTPYYILETQAYGLEVHNRVVSFFGNSNVFAGFMLIGIGLSFSLLINKAKFAQVIPLTSFLTALFFTQSRTGLICAVILVSYILISSLWRSKKKMRLIVFGLLTSIIPIVALSFAPDKFFYRMSMLSDISNDNSFSLRVDIWKEIISDRVMGNILTGTGPVSELHYYYDNEWLQILTNYGVVGILLFLVIFSRIFLKLGKIGKMDIELMPLTVVWRGLIITFAFYMITLAVFQQLQMMPLIMVGLGIIISVYRKNKETEKKKLRRIIW